MNTSTGEVLHTPPQNEKEINANPEDVGNSEKSAAERRRYEIQPITEKAIKWLQPNIAL